MITSQQLNSKVCASGKWNETQVRNYLESRHGSNPYDGVTVWPNNLFKGKSLQVGRKFASTILYVGLKEDKLGSKQDWINLNSVFEYFLRCDKSTNFKIMYSNKDKKIFIIQKVCKIPAQRQPDIVAKLLSNLIITNTDELPINRSDKINLCPQTDTPVSC